MPHEPQEHPASQPQTQQESPRSPEPVSPTSPSEAHAAGFDSHSQTAAGPLNAQRQARKSATSLFALELPRPTRESIKLLRPATTGGFLALKRGNDTGDGFHADAVIARRRAEVAKLSLAGYSIREIAEELGVSPATVAGDRRWAMEQSQAQAAVSVEALRQHVAERLDQSRKHLLSIAAGEPQPRWSCRQGAKDEHGDALERKRLQDALPTISEQIAAERQLARLEEQRAQLLGLSARGDFGKLGDWLEDLAKRRAGGDAGEDEAIDVQLLAAEPAEAPA